MLHVVVRIMAATFIILLSHFLLPIGSWWHLALLTAGITLLLGLREPPRLKEVPVGEPVAAGDSASGSGPAENVDGLRRKKIEKLGRMFSSRPLMPTQPAESSDFDKASQKPNNVASATRIVHILDKSLFESGSAVALVAALCYAAYLLGQA